MPRPQPRLAKLSRPRLHNAVARERLFAMLDEARTRRSAIYVVGPPGAGKTTLVASWLDARVINGIWYQVDAGDADLATFFHYLGLAAAPFQRKGQRPLPALTAEYLADVPGFSRRFFRDLFARLPADATLVLDNYQEVEAPEQFHWTVTSAIAELPHGMALVAISRRDPPEPYARIIANENVAMIDWNALRLTLAEAQAIAANRQVDRNGVRCIHAQADGWAAGVTLMLERGRQGPQPAERAPAARQALFDYFASQIVRGVSPGVRRFLLATAWLPSVSVEVAEALTGNPAAGGILEDLYRRHLFVHRRLVDPPTYHYHALFREFLQAQAKFSLNALDLEALKLSAAELIERTGDTEAGVALYCETAKWAAAIRVIVAGAPRLLSQGRWKTLQDLAGRIPVNEVKSAPWLGYWLARSRLATSPARARKGLLHVLADFEAAEDSLGQILCVAGVLETHWVDSTGHEGFDAWAQRALNLLSRGPEFPDLATELRVLAIVLQALSLRQPYHAMLNRLRDRIASILTSDAADHARLFGGSVLLGLCLPTSNLRLSCWIVEAIGVLAERGTVSAADRLMWLPRLACHYLRCGDDERARATFEQAEALADEQGVRIGWAMRCWWGAHIAMVAGTLAETERYINRFSDSPELNRPFHRGLLHNMRCMAALARSCSRHALEEGRRAISLAHDSGVAWAKVWWALPAIFAMVDEDELDEAEREIASLRHFISATFFDPLQVELLLAESYLALVREARDQCHRLLRAAMGLARELDYCFPMRTAFRIHRTLFCEALRADIDVEYVRTTIHRYRLHPPENAGAYWPWAVKIYTLGRFEVHLEGKPLAFGRKTPRRPVTLLKLLIALGGRSVPEHRVIDALWPGEDGDLACRACEMALHRLRGLLGARDAILVENGTISLNRLICWVDAYDMQLLLTDAAAETEGRLACGELRTAEYIIQLYRGEFLPTDEDALWAVSLREGLRDRYSRYVGGIGARLEREGRVEEAIAWYQRGLDTDNLAESFYQGVMRCYLQAGRNAEGLAAFRRMRELLSVVLGARPSATSEALHRALQSH